MVFFFFFLIPFGVLIERVNLVLYLIDGELKIHDKDICLCYVPILKEAMLILEVWN